MGIFRIKKIIRNDGAVLIFDSQEIYLDEENSLLTLPEVETTSIDFTEADGGEMISQRLSSGAQVINGLIIPRTTAYWALRGRLTSFFLVNHTYAIVYIRKSGEMMKTGPAWIEDELQVPPLADENYSRWSIGFRIGTAGLQEYTEDPTGKEIYAHSVDIGLISAASGGEVWDENGEAWDELGAVWEIGTGGLTTVSVSSISPVYPIWIVRGPAVNPSLRNNSTDTVANYAGAISANQTLVVDFVAGSASLDGSNVTSKLSGEFILVPGENTLGFDIESGTAESSTLKWSNYI